MQAGRLGEHRDRVVAMRPPPARLELGVDGGLLAVDVGRHRQRPEYLVRLTAAAHLEPFPRSTLALGEERLPERVEADLRVGLRKIVASATSQRKLSSRLSDLSPATGGITVYAGLLQGTSLAAVAACSRDRLELRSAWPFSRRPRCMASRPSSS